ncbi:glycosyltransferase [Turicibacter bilis]|uniref:Glycosyltransferase n=1 Tax=Turicibacter bilis TaxID=2735723 RepID=A0A9Q9FG20_9FIRM|nr:glycosyltransferase [Turicibacter bilis]MBS3198660.1 glycosyltransferase [Turicibacter bilis]UUF08321.1 glycosyltransferase [Turicibacter bilis]
MKLVLLTSRNIFNTTGEFRLIDIRAKALYEKHNVKTDIIAINKSSRVRNKELLKSAWYGKTDAVGLGKKNSIISLIKYYLLVQDYLKKNEVDIVITSGIVCNLYRPLLLFYKKKYKFKLLYDMHGAIEEIDEYNTLGINNKVIQRAVYYFLQKLEKSMINTSDSVLVVSKTMREKVSKEYSSKRCIIIPCGINDNNTDFVFNRKKWRRKLDIEDASRVIVYSGGISQWQSIDETLEIIYDFLNYDQSHRACIFSKDLQFIKEKIKHEYINKIRLESLNHTEVSEALSACDVGLIIRKNDVTNNVAFPNKFSEYIQANLIIIISGVISQCNIVNKYNIGRAAVDKSEIALDEIYKLVDSRNENLYKYEMKCKEVFNSELNINIGIQELISYCSNKI